MKGILLTTDNDFTEVEIAHPLYRSAGQLLGGNIEHVRSCRLARPYCMIVNGEGAMLGLPKNGAGCYLFETDEHGVAIFGDVLILKDVWTREGVDIAGLEEEDIPSVTGLLEDVLLEVTCG